SHSITRSANEVPSMTEPAVLPAPRKRRRRWLLLLVPLALVAAAWLYMYSASDRRLAQVAAETDRLDPHWRLDDIQAERATIPDEENRSEEHTSELQSRENLVCRLLLEKKKKIYSL